jgi:hypothetical protein
VETTQREGDGTSALEPDESILEAVEQVDTEASAEVMSLLTEHVPLALLADLASREGPASPEILRAEGLPDVAWWQPEDEAEADDDEDDEDL